MAAIPGADPVSTRQQRIAELARQAPQLGFTSLNHHLAFTWLLAAYWGTRRDGATGVDGITAADYEADLVTNLRSLLDRAKSGSYRAPPVRRVHIAKGPGSKETRPIGIPTLEDKVLQRAVVMLLQPIYEQDFKPCSYGFRPGRSAHQALDDLQHQLMRNGSGWILEVDIRKFFDNLDWELVLKAVRHHDKTPWVLLYIERWLKAPVQRQDGSLQERTKGSPQGAVVSLLLANLFLHHAFDDWMRRNHPRIQFERYADDVIVHAKSKAQAEQLLEA